MPKKSQTNETKQNVGRQFDGTVVSTSDKTIHVLVKTIKMHQKYQKQYTTSKKYAVHDQNGEASVGDEVLIRECRPLSKTKRWRLISVNK